MNADEIKKAGELVRALRDYASDCDDDEACCQCTFAWVCDKFDNNAPKIIADLIENLTAQLSASQRREQAAAEDIWNASANAPCAVCAHGFANTGAPCTVCPCKFEWRGPQEAGKGDSMSEQRLIDAKEASDIIWKRSEEMRDSEPALSGALAAAIGFLNKCKTVPAEAVVHCRECKYKEQARVNKKGFLVCTASGMEITDNDYCSYGERIESEESK